MAILAHTSGSEIDGDRLKVMYPWLMKGAVRIDVVNDVSQAFPAIRILYEDNKERVFRFADASLIHKALQKAENELRPKRGGAASDLHTRGA